MIYCDNNIRWHHMELDKILCPIKFHTREPKDDIKYICFDIFLEIALWFCNVPISKICNRSNINGKGSVKKIWKFSMAFAIKRRTPLPLMTLISSHFYPTIFFCNWIFMKRILHLVPVKFIILKSSYNWFKIDNYWYI